jgi:hypothetical protein
LPILVQQVTTCFNKVNTQLVESGALFGWELGVLHLPSQLGCQLIVEFQKVRESMPYAPFQRTFLVNLQPLSEKKTLILL